MIRGFDSWVEAVDMGKLEIRLEALELRNTRLEEELERERDRRVTDAVERDERQIALGTTIAEREGFLWKPGLGPRHFDDLGLSLLPNVLGPKYDRRQRSRNSQKSSGQGGARETSQGRPTWPLSSP